MKNIVLALAIITLFLSACKKQTAETVCRPIKIITYSTDTTLIEYDAQHRITTIGDAAYTVTITYTGLKATYTDSTGGITNPFYTLYLNRNGNIKSMQ